MLKGKIYKGDIRILTEPNRFESLPFIDSLSGDGIKQHRFLKVYQGKTELYKKSATLIRLGYEDKFIDVDNVFNNIDLIKIYLKYNSNSSSYINDSKIIEYDTNIVNGLYVDQDTIQQFYDEKRYFETISLKNLKRKVNK